MNIGWFCIDGTNDWNTVSILGTCIDIRLSLFQRLLRDGHTIHWFGARKDSLGIHGKQHSRMIGNDIFVHVRKAVREGSAKWKDIPSRSDVTAGAEKTGSRSKLSAEEAMRILHKAVRRKRIEFPECDVLIAEYMDTGVLHQVFFGLVLEYYATRGVPVYVRDPERRFRYVTEFVKMHQKQRSHMYEHRMGRYMSQKFIDNLRGKIRMIYPFDASWDTDPNKFYRDKPLEIAVAYERTRDMDVKSFWDSKTYEVAMIGNDNARRPFMEKWYGGLLYPATIWGNWYTKDPAYVMRWRKLNPQVTFNDPVMPSRVLQTLARGWSTIYHLPPMSIKLGQVTYRACEAAMAGTINISPDIIPRAEQFTLPEFIVKDTDDMNRAVERAFSMPKKGYIEAIDEQRRLAHRHFNADKIYTRFIKALAKDTS